MKTATDMGARIQQRLGVNAETEGLSMASVEGRSARGLHLRLHPSQVDTAVRGELYRRYESHSEFRSDLRALFDEIRSQTLGRPWKYQASPRPLRERVDTFVQKWRLPTQRLMQDLEQSYAGWFFTGRPTPRLFARSRIPGLPEHEGLPRAPDCEAARAGYYRRVPPSFGSPSWSKRLSGRLFARVMGRKTWDQISRLPGLGASPRVIRRQVTDWAERLGIELPHLPPGRRSALLEG